MKVMTLGTFDLVHSGHVKLFKKCRELSGKDGVVVGLNTDEFILSYKGRAPIMTYEERKEMILEVGLVDEVVPNDQTIKGSSAIETVIQSGAKLIVIGSDWAKKDYPAQLGTTWDELQDLGISVCFVPYTKNISTTEIKRRLGELK